MKRRSHNRLSFDSVEPSVSPETRSFSLSNVWKNQPIPESPTQVRILPFESKYFETDFH